MAETAYSSLYDSDNLPTAGHPYNPPMGIASAYVLKELATTQLDTAADATYMIPVPCGRTIFLIGRRNEDLDSGGGGALDMDIVLRTTDKNGVNTDTVLINEGTAFNAARTALVWEPIAAATGYIPASATGVGHIICKVVTAASTAQAGDVEIIAFWR